MTPHEYERSKYTLEIKSDDLVARLRAGQCAEVILFAAADRIEELLGDLKSVLSREAATQERHDNKMEALEAKLAKAVAALEQAVKWTEQYKWAAPWPSRPPRTR